LRTNVVSVTAPLDLDARLDRALPLMDASGLSPSSRPRHRQGKRNRAILAVLVGCGLRRDEAVRLTFDHIQQRDGRWCVVDPGRQEGRYRTVPMPA
jgi:integrase